MALLTPFSYLVKLQLWPKTTVLSFILLVLFLFSSKMVHFVLITFHQFLEEVVLKKRSTPSPAKHVNPLMLLNPSIHPHIKICEP